MKNKKQQNANSGAVQISGAVPLTVGNLEARTKTGETLLPRLTNRQLYTLVDAVLFNLDYNEAALMPLLQLFGYLGNSTLCPDAQSDAIVISDWIYQQTQDFAKRRDAYLDGLFIKS